jgi:hypothetical protein
MIPTYQRYLHRYSESRLKLTCASEFTHAHAMERVTPSPSSVLCYILYTKIVKMGTQRHNTIIAMTGSPFFTLFPFLGETSGIFHHLVSSKE